MNDNLPPSATILHDRPQPSLFHLMLLLSLAVGVVLARWILLATFSSDLPYWDQWDGEIAALYKPFVEGQLTLSQLLSPHNEHRIVFTRLFNLGLFVLNENMFDNLVETFANALLYAVALYSFAWYLLPRMEGAVALLAWLALLAIGVAPYAPENLLVGFQNAFFFIVLFAFVGIGSASFRTTRASFATALLLAVLSQFALASGLLLGPALAVVFVLRWRLGHISPRTAAVVGATALLIGVVGYAFVPVLEHHAALKAQNLADLTHAMMVATSWPLPGNPLCAALVWFPAAIALWRVVVLRKGERIDVYLLGVGVWIFLQQIAVAHTRGHDLATVPSRYTDLMAFAPVVNLALAARLWQDTASAARRRFIAAVASLAFLAVTAGFALASLSGIGQMIHTADNYAQSRANIRAYFDGRGGAAFDGKPGLLISYPVASRLDQLLQDPAIRAMLPASIQPPATTTPVTCDGFESFGSYPTTAGMAGAIGSYRRGIGNPSVGTCDSGPYAIARSQILVRVAGYPLKPAMSLELRAHAGATRRIAPPLDPGESWLDVLVPNPQPPFDLIAADSNPEFWFAYTQPVGVGRLSALCLGSSRSLNLRNRL